MNEIVLDASAVLAFIQNEAGANVVLKFLENALISSVNLSEVIAKLSEKGLPGEAIRQVIDGLNLDVRTFDEAQAYRAGLMFLSTRSRGISFGDRACLSLGKTLGAEVLTADKLWAGLEIGVKIKLIR